MKHGSQRKARPFWPWLATSQPMERETMTLTETTPDIGEAVKFSIRHVQTGKHLFFYVGTYRGLSHRHADEARIRLSKKLYPDGYTCNMYGVTVFPLSRLETAE